MKLCPVCNRCFEDQVNYCSDDQGELIIARPGECVIDEKYRLERLLAHGGMGAVYASVHLTLERLVAVKLLLPAFIVDPEALERFRREALTAARVKHPNLAEIYDYGVLPGGGAYIVMEYVDGITLRDYMKAEGRLSLLEAANIVRQVAEGAEAAHRAGIVHRDLKPANLILARNPLDADQWQPKIVDFGIAKFMEQTRAGESTLTATGSLVGTPRYMSPEQCLGEPMDARSDIYSLGIILYEMLAGQPPFDAPSGTAIALKHTQEPPPPIESFRPEVPEPLAQLVMQLLDKDPALRPQTAAEVASRLLEIEKDLALTTPKESEQFRGALPEADIPPSPSFVNGGKLSYETASVAIPLDELPTAGGGFPERPRKNPPGGNEVGIGITTKVIKVEEPKQNILLADSDTGSQRPAVRDTQPIPVLQSHRRALLWVAVTMAIIALGLGTGAVWFFQRGTTSWVHGSETSSPTPQPTATIPARAEKTAISKPESAGLEAERQMLGASLSEWITATNDGDIERQMSFYLPTVETFYRTHNVMREDVRAEKLRVLGEAQMIDVRANAPVISFSGDGQTAIMRFRKQYVIEGPEDRQGEVLQELRWRKTEDGWKIGSERDLKVLR